MSVNQFGYQDIKISISGNCGHVRYGQRENDFYNARSILRENLVPLVLINQK